MLPYKGVLLIVAALLFVEAMSALILPSYMADLVNDGVLTGHIPLIWRNGAIMMAITMLGMFVALVAGYFTARLATGVANDLREDVFRKVLRFSDAEINRFATSSLITRTTNDISQIQSAMMMAIRQFIYAPIIGVGGIIRAVERNAPMMWVVAVATLAMVITMAVMFVVAMPKFTMIQGLIDRLNLVSRENLNGILVVRAFSTQKFERGRFAKANRDLAETNLFVDYAFSFLFPIIMLIMNLTTAFTVWVGARQVSAFRADIGDIFAFLQYGMLIIFAFLMLAITFVVLPRAVISAGRVQEVLEAEGSIKFKASPTPLPKDFKGVVEFDNVSFRYPDAQEDDDNVLDGISFTARPGQTTAIIGATGSGKTSVLRLLLRFFDVRSGCIRLDGIDIRDLHKQELHGKIGFVPQKAQLFTGSIRSNLLYADKDASEEQILAAATTAQAAAFIEGKPGGYEHAIAQGGSNLSGGQRQRLSIARALVKNAQIYLFDDSFSALDLKTDAALRHALKRETGGSTVIIVAQRISTIMDAHRIIVLDNGTIASKGTHAELMRTCEVYREIAASQLSEEELSK